MARFDKTVLRALQETETALSAFNHEMDRRRALSDARAEAATAARIVRPQFREGRVDSLSLIDAERALSDTEASLASSDARVVTAQLDLFRALAGGWQADAHPLPGLDATTASAGARQDPPLTERDGTSGEPGRTLAALPAASYA